MREKRNKKITPRGAIQKGVIYWFTQNYWQEVDIRANYFHLFDEESFGMQRLAETVSNAMKEREPVLPFRTVRMRSAGKRGVDKRGAKSEEDTDSGHTRKLTRNQQTGLLRLRVDTVGRSGRAGEQIQNLISVGMLSEG